MERRNAETDDRGELDDLDVFATGSTVLHLVEHDPGAPAGRPMRDLIRQGGESVRDGWAHLGDYHARPGYRPGARPVTSSARRGGDTDIVRPLLVDPTVAVRIVCAGGPFEHPVPHLRLLPGDAASMGLLVWSVIVSEDGRRGVPANLHLLASPSMVVTVLELIPRRRLRFGRDRFVRTAVAAVDELARRIELAAA